MTGKTSTKGVYDEKALGNTFLLTKAFSTKRYKTVIDYMHYTFVDRKFLDNKNLYMIYDKNFLNMKKLPMGPKLFTRFAGRHMANQKITDTKTFYDEETPGRNNIYELDNSQQSNSLTLLFPANYIFFM